MCRPSLLPEHVEFLTSKESLKRDAHLSLMQRVKKFNTTFDNFEMTYYRIRKLFKEQEIRQKVLHVKPMLSDKQKQAREIQKEAAFKAMLNHISKGDKVIFADEAAFTAG